MSAKKLIGVFATEVSSRVQGNFYRELHRKAKQFGYNLLVFSGTYDKVKFKDTTPASEELYHLAKHLDFAAFVVHAQSICDTKMMRKLIALGKEKQIPVFVYDAEAYGITKAEGVIPLNTNYKQGFRECVKHLIEYHHCNEIFMLAGPKGNNYSEDRIEMFKQELVAHDMSFCEEQVGYGNFWEIPAAAAVNQYLDSDRPMPDAICCANDAMALTAIKELKKRGLRVPDDILVTGFDGIEDGKFSSPSLSSCEPRWDTVASFVFRVLAGEEHDDEFAIPLRFDAKESCGCSSGYNPEEKKEITRLFDNARVNTWQHDMLVTMQFNLIDSTSLADTVDYMKGNLDLFKGYSHLFCIRDDIETETDYTKKLSKMRVLLNKDFLPEAKYKPFTIKKITPDFVHLLEEAEKDDIFLIRMVHNAEKKYGYYMVKTKGFYSNDLRLLGQFTESVTIVLENILRNERLSLANEQLSSMYERMSEIYIKDTMTGLYNRHGYYRDLDLLLQREELQDDYLHIISVDMDGMKYINDNFGHLEGDNAIKSVARAIQECFRPPFVGARFGGDEFIVAQITKEEDGEDTAELSTRLNAYLKNMPMLAGKGYPVIVSVGQSVAKVSELVDYKTLEKQADDFMYREKRRHKKETKK